MIKKKSILSITLIVLILGSIYYGYFIDTHNKSKENFEKYIAKQGIEKDNIKDMEKTKDTKIGGILYSVTYKDDPNLTYEYLYSNKYKDEPYNIVLIVYHGQSESILDGIKPKHPALKIEI